MPPTDEEKLRFMELERARAIAKTGPEGSADFLGKEGPGMISAFLKGAGQGATFGNSDEIMGHIAAPIMDKPYLNVRDKIRNSNESSQKESPIAYGSGQTIGGVLTSLIPGLSEGGLLALLAKSGAMGALSGFGYSKKEGTAALPEAATGAATNMALAGAAHTLSGGLSNAAEKLAVRGTGATGKEALKFSDDAGRQLLDRGITRFGSSPESQLARATVQSENAGKGIGNALSGMDEMGLQNQQGELVDHLQGNVQKLVDAGDLRSASQAQDKIETLKSDMAQHLGDGPLNLSYIEKLKRGFKDAWKNPETEQAGKNIYSGLQSFVEDKATTANPELANNFSEEKKSFGLMAPIQKALERKSSQLSQRVAMGLLDTGAGGLAYKASSDRGDSLPEALAKGVAGGVARHYLGPRIIPSLAVMADTASKAAPSAAQGLAQPIIDLMQQHGVNQKLIDLLGGGGGQ